jgi:hypothetical protein
MMISLNAALYAGIGILTNLGIFAPIVGVVRFWGIPVVIPAIFAALFGPLVGGLGAAIGIFISDMMIHGHPLLSITVGVPANFVMFYLIGWIIKNPKKNISLKITTILGSIIIGVIFLIGWIIGSDQSLTMAIIFLSFGILCIISLSLFEKYWPRWKIFALASIVGNGIGSAIVGLGVWACSHFFILPLTLGQDLPFIASIILFTFVFSNQMPFLLLLCPPILKTCHKIFPEIITQHFS